MTTDRSVTTPVPLDARDTVDADEALARAAYAELERLFASHVTGFMLDAGRYIIDTFYDGDARLALTKRGTAKKKNSLWLLVAKLKSAPEHPTGNAPSVRWFYNAVSLAAHEMIFAQRRSLQTFANLGHSHKLLLLSVPKIASIRAATDVAAIDAAFDEKERLAQIAVDEHLSVRDFARRISEEYPGQRLPFSVDDLPPPSVLRRQTSKTLRGLYDKARGRFDKEMESARRYHEAMGRIGAVMAETADAGDAPSAVPAAAVTFCTGCISDCRYCPEKIALAADPSLKTPTEWRRWELQPDAVERKRTLLDGPVAFPAGHDIFPEILDAAIAVMGNLLRAGNRLVVTCRPRRTVIEALCAAGACFKDRIEFRCVIGAADDDTLSFWEPGAPGYGERKEALALAHAAGFRTSVAAVPMLDTDGIAHLVRDLSPFATEGLWLGGMKQIDEISNWSRVSGFQEHLTMIREGQTPRRLGALKEEFSGHPLVRWMPETFGGDHGSTVGENEAPER